MNYNEELSDIQEEMLGEVPETYSKLKGTWLWEIFKAFAIKIYDLLQLLTDTAGKLNIENLQGDELDAYVSQWTDVRRKTAQRASGYIEAKGNGMIYKDTLVASEGVQYTVTEDVEVIGTALVPITATEPGEVGNAAANTITKLITSNAYISSITNPEAVEGGADEEDDDALRQRYHLRLSMPATSGNKAHYILWARQCRGVGGAKAARDTEVRNKVNIYICSDDGTAADENTIAAVQEYIDPNENGDGSGVAPVGAICEVFSAGIKNISIAGVVELDNTLDEETTVEGIRDNINEYLSKINFSKTELSYAKLLDIAINSEGVNDITGFTLNEGYVNISCEETEIFILSEFDMEVE